MEWITRPLGEITSYMAKGIPPKYTEEETENTVRVLNQKCNRNFTISYADSRIHDCTQKKVPGDKLLKKGDVLINSTGTGTAGRVAQMMEIPIPTTIDGHMILLRPSKEMDEFYYGYAVKAHQAQIETLAEGSTGQTEINRNRLQTEVMITYPENKKVQAGIASFLWDIDRKIEANNKINENLQQQAATVFHQWFVANPESEKWPSVTLDSLTSLVSRGIAPKYTDDSTQIVLNQKCIRDHYIDISLARRHNPKVINEKWLQYGDLLINSTGEGTLGRAAQVWFVPVNMTVDSHVTIVRPKGPHLLFYIGLWGISHEREIEALHTGSTGQTELPRERVKAMELRLPDNDTLARFNVVIAPIVSLIITNQQENVRLSSIRDALLPKLMSGEIDVSDIQL